MSNWLEFFKTINKLGVTPTKIAEVILDDSKKCNFSYSVLDTSWVKIEGWVYFIVIEGELVKIGKTDKTLSHRFASYTSGTEENRQRGTCSTTNYHLSQLFLYSLIDDRSVEIYGFSTPKIETTIEVLGTKETVVFHTTLKYEKALLMKHKEMFGNYPLFSKNSNQY